MKKHVLIILLGIILVVSIAILITPSYLGEDLGNELAKRDEIDTAFTLTNLSEEKVSLSDFKGKKVFLNFWATWCPPCKSEMPYVNEIYKEAHDIEIITISSNESKKTVQEYVENNNYEFLVLLDYNGKIARQYNAHAIPTSILIDEEGNIIDTHVGAMSKDELIKFMRID